MSEPLNKKLYEKVKREADKKYDRPSAYKSGYIVKKYKSLGGKYAGKKDTDEGLSRWFKEEWTDLNPKGDYPVYRPTKRITKDTPLTADEIDKKQLKRQIKKKNKGKENITLPKFEKEEGSGLPVKDIKNFLSKSYEKKPSSYNEYIIDESLSGQRVQVYNNPITNKTIVVHRGTDSIQDWGTNLAMTFGIKGKRFNHAKRIQDEAERKYGKENIITLGHSQGGRWAELLGRDTSEVITLNKPTLPLDLLRRDKVPENQSDIKSTNDPVSVLRKYQLGNEPEKIRSDLISNPIKEHSVEVLNKLPDDYFIGLPEETVGSGLGKEYEIKKSTRKNKKYDVYKNDKYLLSFGDKRYEQWKDSTPLKAYKHLDHGDQKRKDNYYKRFGKDAKKDTPKWFSHKFLW